jgi:acetylornithine/succinyldiaminopimelate/putrescine aminotransferase
MLTKPEIAPSLRPGMHAATFGGNPIAAAAGIATIEMIERDNLLARGKQLGELFRQRLGELQQQCDLVREVRVRGVMIGVELSVEGAPVVKGCLERNLLINCTHGTVIRLLPALTLSDAEAHEGCDILIDVVKRHAASTAAVA